MVLPRSKNLAKNLYESSGTTREVPWNCVDLNVLNEAQSGLLQKSSYQNGV